MEVQHVLRDAALVLDEDVSQPQISLGDQSQRLASLISEPEWIIPPTPTNGT